MTTKARTVKGQIVELKYAREGFFTKEYDFGRPTIGMIVTPRAFSKISHLFDDDGRPASELLEFNHNGYKWKLYAKFSRNTAQHLKEENSGVRSSIWHPRIYGVCGDYSFGHTPSWMKSSLSGNKRAARAIYTEFLKRLEEKRGVIVGTKFGF